MSAWCAMTGSKETKKDHSLRLSYSNGIFASGMTGFTQEYFTPFLLLLGGTAGHVGLLSAFPNFFSSVLQLLSPGLNDRIKSRKKIVLIFTLLQAMVLLAICTLAVMGRMDIRLFIFHVVLFTVFGALANPSWGSLLADLVAANKRGIYFGWRNRNLGLIIVLTSLVAGVILHQMRNLHVFWGFIMIFGLAFFFRGISAFYLALMHEPHWELKKENYFSFFQFLARLRQSNFAKFVMFIALMNFSVNLAAPFFSVLMLRDLGFSYLQYAMINITATLAVYLFMSRWGIHADKIGNLKIIRFVAPLIGLIPMLWIVNRNPVFLFFAQLLSGFLWAGFNLCSTNFIYDAVSPGKWTRCISYFNVLNGLALSLGALLGGYLIVHLPNLFGYKILTIFLLSSLLRLAVGLILPSKLREVRPIEHVSSNDLFFSMVGVRPILGIDRKSIPIEEEP